MEKIFFENNEDEVMEFFSKTFKEENFKPLVKKEKDEVITEGLKFNKASVRLYKLSDKVYKKSEKKPELLQTVKKINKLAETFEYVEDLYQVGRKTEAKTQYKKLCTEYSELLKLLRKEAVKDSLKKAGLAGVTIATMIVPYILMNKFFPSLSFGNVNSKAFDLPFQKQIPVYLKRAGAFTLCGLPTKFIRNGIYYGTEASDEKAIKFVDRLLNSQDLEIENT